MNSIHKGNVVIIGAGLAGLSAAFDLGRLGFRTYVLEASDQVGGLASSLQIEGRPIERFYHFICKRDYDLLNMVQELSIEDQLHWTQTKTSFFYDGRMYPFGTPFDLLLFHPVPLLQRIRFGLNIVQSRFRKSWLHLDGLAAKSWLTAQIGEKAYKVIWDPLLRIKFGEIHDHVSAAWIWHRINRVAASRRRIWEREFLGYLEYGSETVIQALLGQLRQMPNVNIKTHSPVKRIHIASGAVDHIETLQGDMQPADHVISTVAIPTFLKLVPDLDRDYSRKLGQVEYLGVVCGLLKLRRPLTDSFWINMNHPTIPFNGFIEYSNLNQHLGISGKSIVYVPYYLKISEPRFSFSDEKLIKEFHHGLSLVNPAFDESWVEEVHISREPYAQAICTVGFSEVVPAHQTPIRGLYITDSTQYYPEDRTISAAIRLGRKVASLIAKQHGHSEPEPRYAI